MKIKFEKFEHKWRGYKEVLQSGAVTAILEAKGQRVRGAIDLPEVGDEWEVIVSSRKGVNRAKVLVSGVPMSIEKKRGVLGSAIDAARG